ncbi:hypothetical protein GDO86_013213, partial [Hymenochirus boettgeri]
DSGFDSVTDSEAEEAKDLYSLQLDFLEPDLTQEKCGNLLSVQPERIHCGVKTQIFFIFKCKIDCKMKNEVYFTPRNGQSILLPAILQNEYVLTVDAPDLPSGLVFVKVFSGDLIICEYKITYFTDMEEISNLLTCAANPVEFMCQAFKIVPYNIDVLDKLLTESLKNNIPASGLHLFGINQIEEENLHANQRDEELPTLLHFSAKYGLKNLTALLLTCPGALQAYSVSNKKGDFPNNIAEKYGFKDLRQFIDEYVETADMLKTHIKEELMLVEDKDNTTYESMANCSTDLLMKCSLNPGCYDDLYESMANLRLPHEDMDMMQAKGFHSKPEQDLVAKDSVIRKILEGGSNDLSKEAEDPYLFFRNDKVYDIVKESTGSHEPVCRPPVPVPRPPEFPEMVPYISKEQKTGNRDMLNNTQIYFYTIFLDSSVNITRDRPQSSLYDPFVGMKTPGQRELITLQERVKCGMITVDDALLQFKEWQLNQKRRSDSFRFQQENLKKLRDSINRRRFEKKKKKSAELKITEPIRRGHNNTEVKPEIGVYEIGPIMRTPPKKTISRGNWKTDSTSSTASSASNRSSTRSSLSLSSGMEGDNERSPMQSLQEERPPPRPPRIPNR